MLKIFCLQKNIKKHILSLLIIGVIGSVSGCSTPTIDPAMKESISTIKISDVAPNNCYYIGEAISFHLSHKGYALDLFDTESQIIKFHNQKLRIRAKTLNANYIHTVYSRNTGLMNVAYIHAFYKCGGTS